MTDSEGETITRLDSSVDNLVVNDVLPGAYDVVLEGMSGGYVVTRDTHSITVTGGDVTIPLTAKSIASGTGSVALTIVGTVPEGFTAGDIPMEARLVKDGAVVREDTLAWSEVDGALSVPWTIADLPTGVYSAEVSFASLEASESILVLNGLVTEGTAELNVASAEKVATPVIEDGPFVAIGDVVEIDGIECVVVYDAGSQQEWGRYLAVDRNHDISFYTEGSDFYNTMPSANDSAKYGYEWGGATSTMVKSEEIGTGLSNTNALIALDLVPSTSGWSVLWDKVEEFREIYSNKWFVPSIEEMEAVYESRIHLRNMSTTYMYYWVSSEYNSYTGLSFGWGSGNSNTAGAKSKHNRRARLCTYIEDSSINTISIQGDTSDLKIYYTLNGTEPTMASTLYTGPFKVKGGTTVKARAFKEGMSPSDVVWLTTEDYDHSSGGSVGGR